MHQSLPRHTWHTAWVLLSAAFGVGLVVKMKWASHSGSVAVGCLLGSFKLCLIYLTVNPWVQHGPKECAVVSLNIKDDSRVGGVVGGVDSIVFGSIRW